MPFPAWLAVIEHVPTATSVTVVPDTVQIPVLFDAYATVSPELAVAVNPNGALPNGCPLNAPNAIVCVACATLNVRVTGVAAA